ncbi:MAG: hypothetical protein EU548_02185 [Promethearchaeota archaeon]|nr:MAG: hypothetical protein EU548_02185 [Candidatus Lokiarchaeota archaeon]
MIKKLYIIAESSANLFTYAPLETKTNDIQEQLITGFITANVSFSKAVIGKDLNTIRVGGERLIFFEDNSGLIIAAIADTRDSIMLLRRVMTEIMDSFHMLFKKELKQKNIDFSRTDKARDFKYFIDELCKKYIYSRETWKNILAVVTGITVSFFLSFFFLNPSSNLFNFLIDTINSGITQMDIRIFGLTCFIIQLILFSVLAPGSFISGLIAADRKNGKIAAIIHYLVLILIETIYYFTNPFYMFLDSITIFFYIYILLVFFPAIFLVVYYLGDLGGWLLTRVRLYPLEELKMKAHEYIKLRDDII